MYVCMYVYIHTNEIPQSYEEISQSQGYTVEQ